MNPRRRTAMYVCALAGALLAYGCGSGSNFAETADLSGSYVGTFVLVNGATAETGTMAVVIGPDNRMAGTVHNDTTGADGTVAGEIENGLALSAKLTYPGDERTLIGNVGFDTRLNLVGALRHYNAAGARAGTLSIDLAPAGAGGDA